jgi:hypothetical protein
MVTDDLRDTIRLLVPGTIDAIDDLVGMGINEKETHQRLCVNAVRQS